MLKVFGKHLGGLGEVGDSMDGVSIGWLVCMGARLVVVPAASLAFPRVAAQFHRVASGSGPTFIFLSWESFALFGLVDDTRLNFTTTLAIDWKDLLAKGVTMLYLCFMNSTIFFFNDGKGWTSIPQGLNLMICIHLSFL